MGTIPCWEGYGVEDTRKAGRGQREGQACVCGMNPRIVAREGMRGKIKGATGGSRG